MGQGIGSAEFVIAGLNLILGVGCGWPLAALIVRVLKGWSTVRRQFAVLLLIYLAECAAFSASMATDILTIALAFVWGFALRSWIRRSAAEKRDSLKVTYLFALYTCLPAVSFLSVPVMCAFGGWSIRSVEEGARFGIPAFVPHPVNTILGFSLAVVVVAVVFKVAITAGLVRGLVRDRRVRTV